MNQVIQLVLWAVGKLGKVYRGHTLVSFIYFLPFNCAAFPFITFHHNSKMFLNVFFTLFLAN